MPPASNRPSKKTSFGKPFFWVVAIFFFVLPWQACGPSLIPLDGGLDALRRGPGSGGNGNGDVYTGMRSLKTLAQAPYQPSSPILPAPTDEYHRFVKGQQCSAQPTEPQHAGLLRYFAGEWKLRDNACSASERTVAGITIQSYSPEVLSWENKIFGLSERRDDLFTSAYPLAWCRSSKSPSEGLSVVIGEKIIDATPAGDGALNLQFPNDLGPLPAGVTFARPETKPTATYVDARKLIATAAVGAPRSDHDPVTGDARGLLIEEARTNVALQSAALELWTRSSGAKVTANASIAPDGLTAAESVAMASSSDSIEHVLPLVSTSTPLTFSIFVKSTTGSVVLEYSNATTLASATFDLVNGKVSGVDGTARARIEPSGNKFVRLVFTFDHLAGVGARVRLSSPQTRSFAAWGAQIEEGAFATSYIATAQVPVRRAAETLAATRVRIFDRGIGALYIKFSPLAGQTTGTAFDARDGSGRSWSGEVAGSNFVLNLRNQGTIVDSTSLGTIKGYDDLRVAFATANQKLTTAVSGALRNFQSPIALAPSAFESLTFGRNGSGEAPLSGHLRHVMQWNHELAYGTLVHTSGAAGMPLPLQGQISLGDASTLDRRQVFNFQVDRRTTATGALGFIAPDYDFDLRVTRPATSSTNGTATIEVAIDDVLYRDELTCVLEPANIN